MTRHLAGRERREMAHAAQTLLADYTGGKDLIAFTDLDAEDVR